MNGPTDYVDSARVVFLLGAGASRHMRMRGSGEPVPADAQFFPCASRVDQWCTEPELGGLGLRAYSVVKDALAALGVHESVLAPPDGSSPMISMEDAFCHLEILRMLGAKHQPGNGSKEWDYASEAFVDLIALVVGLGCLPPAGSAGGYRSLVQSLLSKRSGSEYTFLTLNYELGIEYAINEYYQQSHGAFDRTKSNLRSRGLPEGYVGQGDLYYYGLVGRHQPSRAIGEAPILLKLHGSCNWAVCPECGNVTWLWGPESPQSEVLTAKSSPVRSPKQRRSDEYDPGRVVGTGNLRERCPWHARDAQEMPLRRPYIVPPTWNKWMGDETMKHIWRQAYRALIQCERLFIIGTSLPETDRHLRMLLWSALKARGGNLPQIHIVDYKTTEQEQVSHAKKVSDATGIQVTAQNSDQCVWATFDEQDTIKWIADRVG